MKNLERESRIIFVWFRLSRNFKWGGEGIILVFFFYYLSVLSFRVIFMKGLSDNSYLFG